MGQKGKQLNVDAMCSLLAHPDVPCNTRPILTASRLNKLSITSASDIIIMVFMSDFIAHCWATFSALRALLSSHIMTNKDDGDDDMYEL